MAEKLYFSYQNIHDTVRTIAEHIMAADFKYDLIVAIGTGGFIPARILKTYLDLPILTVGISYYDHENKPKTSPEKIQWIDEVEEKLKGKKILLVDEVDDSRSTLEYCIRELLSHAPSTISVAVLHNKLKEKRGVIPEEVRSYIAGADLEDKWICYPWDALDIFEHDTHVHN